MPSQSERRSVVREIQRTRLGGIDRIVLDTIEDDEPLARYAHIYNLHGCSTTLHTTDDPDAPDVAYRDVRGFELLGVIDLDTGDLAKEQPKIKEEPRSVAAAMVDNGEVPF